MSALLKKITSRKEDAPILISVIIALCLAFSPLLFNFIWGNHDWLPLINDNRLSHGLIEGRFSQYLLQNIFLMGKILPLANILLGFFFYTLALYLLCRYYYGFQASRLVTALFLCSMATLPFMVEILYFHFITFSLLSWPLIVVLALLCCRRAGTSHPFIFTMAGTLLLLFALGGYPPVVNLFVTAAACRLIGEYCLENKPFKTVCKSAVPYLISLFLAFLLLVGIFAWLQENHRMLPLYNSQASTLMELIKKLPQTLAISLQSFIIPQSFLPLPLKVATSIAFLLFSGLFLFRSTSISDLFLRILMILLLLLAVKFSAWLVNETSDSAFAAVDPAAFMIRADFYGFPALLLFCLIYLHRRNQGLKNIALLLAVCLLSVGIKNDLAFAKTHLFGFSAENKLLERFISRIQEHPSYQTPQTYTIIQAGELPLRRKYYTPAPHEKLGYYTLNAPYTRHWIAFEYYNFYAPEVFIRGGTSIRPENITPAMATFLTEKIGVWPVANSLYIDDNYVIIALTPEGKELLTGQFRLLTPPPTTE